MTIKEVSEKFNLTQDTLRYYERVGMIPTVNRTNAGIRDYKEADIAWVELAKCMRSSGLSVEVLVEYVKLFQEGDSTIKARLSLLSDQRDALILQQQKINASLEKLDYKIKIYGEALETGILKWNKEDCHE